MIVSLSSSPTPPEPSSSGYYIKWRPSNIQSGYFTVSGVNYNFSDYPSGIFWFDSSCSGYWDDRTYRDSSNNIIVPGIYSNPYITYLETNLEYISMPITGPSVPRGGTMFFDLPNLSMISMSKCVELEADALPNAMFSKCGSSSVYTSLYLPECSWLFVEIGANPVYKNYISEISLPKCHKVVVNTFPTDISVTFGWSSVVIVDDYTGTVGYHAFVGKSGVSIFVPSSLVSTYKSHYYWSYYASLIFPIPE